MVSHMECMSLEVKLDLMLNSGLCDYSDGSILVSGGVTITRRPEDATLADKRKEKRDKETIFQNCIPFIECTSKRFRFCDVNV